MAEEKPQVVAGRQTVPISLLLLSIFTHPGERSENP